MFRINITDPDWIDVLRTVPRDVQVNFWRSDRRNFNLPKGSWIYFNERGTQNIVGRGIFIGQETHTIDKAWQLYRIGNGVNSLEEFRKRAEQVLHLPSPNAEIGCLMLTEIQLLEPDKPYVANENVYQPAQNTSQQFEDAELPSLQTYFKNPENTATFETNKASSKLLKGDLSYSYRRGYERNPEARKQCLEHHTFRCKACGLLLEEKYGPIATELIHVHHLIPISNFGQKKEVDPINELAPLCPNCHAVAHRREPPFSIEEIKSFLDKKTI
jgi:HNH endonuclease